MQIEIRNKAKKDTKKKKKVKKSKKEGQKKAIAAVEKKVYSALGNIIVDV